MEGVLCETQLSVKQFGEKEKVEGVRHVDGQPLQPAPRVYISHAVDEVTRDDVAYDVNKPRVRKISFR